MRALLIGTLAVTLMAPTVAAPGKPNAADIAEAKKMVTWLRSLHTFSDATESDPLRDSPPSTFSMVITRLSSKHDDVVVDASSWDGNDKITLFARHWNDADVILLRALEKHFGGSAGDPITPDMALQQATDRDAVGIDHYLDAGKTEFTWFKDTPGLQMCPWKGDCYIAEITPTPP